MRGMADLLQLRGVAASKSLILLMAMGGGCDNVVPRERFAIGRVCVVADRGMISAATIAGLEERKLEYILGARERSDAIVRKIVLENDDPFLLRDLDRLAQVRIRHRGADWLVRTDAAPAVTILFKCARIALPPRAHQARPPPAPSKSVRNRRGRPKRSATPT